MSEFKIQDSISMALKVRPSRRTALKMKEIHFELREKSVFDKMNYSTSGFFDSFFLLEILLWCKKIERMVRVPIYQFSVSHFSIYC